MDNSTGILPLDYYYIFLPPIKHPKPLQHKLQHCKTGKGNKY